MEKVKCVCCGRAAPRDQEGQAERREETPLQLRSLGTTLKFNVLCRFWDPICGHYGKTEKPANKMPLTQDEADVMSADLLSCVSPDYQGQGQAILSMRIAPVS